MSVLEVSRDRFLVSTNKERLDPDAIHAVLSESYWAHGIPREVVLRAIQGSLCFGLYEDARQLGFARVVTDRATFAYLMDVYVIEEFRGQGLGTFLMDVVCAHPDLQNLRCFRLATRDAHAFYARAGFRALSEPTRHLEILRPNVYETHGSGPRVVEPQFLVLEPTLSPPADAVGPEPGSREEEPTRLVVDFGDVERAGASPTLDTKVEPSRELVAEAPVLGLEPGSNARVVRVRALGADEGPLLRELRLGALRESPHTFGERLEDALARPPSEWVQQARTLADASGPRVFIAEVDFRPAGLALAVDDPNDTGVCRVGGMWVHPRERRVGAGLGMLRAIRVWARGRYKQRLRVWVQKDAPPARALFEAFGFSYTGIQKPFPREPARGLLEMDLVLE